MNKEQRSRITVSIALGNDGCEGGKANPIDEDSQQSVHKYIKTNLELNIQRSAHKNKNKFGIKYKKNCT